MLDFVLIVKQVGSYMCILVGNKICTGMSKWTVDTTTAPEHGTKGKLYWLPSKCHSEDTIPSSCSSNITKGQSSVMSAH